MEERNEVVFQTVCGKSALVDTNKCSNWIKNLLEILANFSSNDIVNFDETGLSRLINAYWMKL